MVWYEAIYKVVSSIAILVGGGWAFWKFVLQRENFPRPEFELDLNVIGKQKGKYLIELSAVLKNHSQVRLVIPTFYFSFFFLERDQPIEEGDKAIHQMVKFKRVVDKRQWMPNLDEKDEYTFVDAGTTQRYSYVTSLPESATFAMIQSRFYYTDRESDFHSAQKCFKVEEKISAQANRI